MVERGECGKRVQYDNVRPYCIFTPIYAIPYLTARPPVFTGNTS